ncbi:MAG: hypothetical protein EA406_01315 [Rhodospirillales bacterium]|nr:MAG: hypothetical protein EA406_01315 [Rhodospirillales bacterium]
MSCVCDRPVAGTPRIPPGLPMLPHPIHDFARLRSAMLASIPDFAGLDGWTARGEDDLGVMLIEFFAYAGHTVAFYNWVAANETYLRTAFRAETVAGITALTGYTPRPAAPATAEVAAIVSGPRPVVVPPGTRFRSAAFEGSPPQIFETEAKAALHAGANGWAIRAPRLTTLGAGGGLYTASHLDLEPERARFEPDDLVLIRTPAGLHGMFTVVAVEDAAQADSTPVRRVTFDRAINLANTTPVAAIDLLKPTQAVSLFTVPTAPDALIVVGIPFPMPAYQAFTLDRQRADLKPGQPVVLSRSDDHRWFTVASVRSIRVTLVPAQTVNVTIEVDGSPVTSTTTIPASTTTATRFEIDVDYNAPNRRKPGFGTVWPPSFTEQFVVRYGFVRAGRVAAAPVMEIWPTGPLKLQPEADRRVTLPPDPETPRRFLLSDETGLAYAVNGTLDPATGSFVFAEVVAWPSPLTPPVTLEGNVVAIRRGETIADEVIGSGNAALAGQSFKLAKEPVAFRPDITGATERGYRSTVSVRVNGVLWDEVEQLVVAGPEDEVFMLDQTPDQETLVVTGDGTHGRRVPTGAGNVTGTYVFGAGEAAPPAESISQIVTPVDGLSAVVNRIAASGGADAERPEDVKLNAPAVALLLGRIVSLDDVLAVSRAFPGVTAARADWVWHNQRQTAAIEVWCIAAEAVIGDLRTKIRNLSEPGLAVAVEAALPVPLRLAIQVEIDPRRDPADVEDAVRRHLMDPRTGLLPPSRIGIGLPLFRSRIFAEVLKVAGTRAVPALSHDGIPFEETGLTPGAGKYFDVPAGGLVINGREKPHGE